MKTLRIILLSFLPIVMLGCGGSTTKDVKSDNAVNQGGSVMGNPIVQFETTQGVIKAELYPDVKVTTQNFLDLVGAKFYDGLTFHRYEPGFVIQGGDPEGTGMGGSEKKIPLEIVKKYRHDKGALGMARSQDPNSASCQFYICLDAANFLDDNYAVFGKVTEGMENALKLRKGDKMTKVTVLK